jgi:hypothetical protein
MAFEELMQIPLKLKRECVERAAMLLEPEKYYGNKKMKDFVVYTPKKVVDEMLDLLPKEIWSDPNVTFIDICSKSGVFLERIYWRLYHGLRKYIPTGWKRSDHILTKQLFAFGLDKFCANNTRSVLYGAHKANSPYAYTTQFKDEDGNVKVLEHTIDGYTFNFRDVIQNEELFMEVVRRAFGDMKFDVVIGNPPYNRGMDLDFVHMGFKLCQKYCVMITPAKWQTAADDYRGCASKTINYKQFRKKLVPYMSKVVFYPDSFDVFGAAQADGISYYILDKQKEGETCIIENRCKLQDKLNSITERSITNRETLYNIGHEIINYLGEYKVWKFDRNKKGRYKVWTNNQIPVAGGRIKSGGGAVDGGGNGGCLLSLEGNCLVIGISRIIDTLKSEKPPVEASDITFVSDDINECRSFISWLNTKFTRFFVLINISKLTGILTDDYFRFVPAPPSGKFDHIYTDEELYKAFNLPQEYIDVIEAVIKERKLEF